jgi:hypothetical protein
MPVSLLLSSIARPLPNEEEVERQKTKYYLKQSRYRLLEGVTVYSGF